MLQFSKPPDNTISSAETSAAKLLLSSVSLNLLLVLSERICVVSLTSEYAVYFTGIIETRYLPEALVFLSNSTKKQSGLFSLNLLSLNATVAE